MFLDVINYMNSKNFSYIKLASDSLSFSVNDKKIIYAIGKKTPKKNGYFLRIYKRNRHNKIEPFNATDLDYLLIKLDDKEYLLIHNQILLFQNIIGENGRTGWRVYSSICKINNNNAKKQKEWQEKFIYTI